MDSSIIIIEKKNIIQAKEWAIFIESQLIEKDLEFRSQCSQFVWDRKEALNKKRTKCLKVNLERQRRCETAAGDRVWTT